MIRTEVKDGVKEIVISNPRRKNAITPDDAKKISFEIFNSINDENVEVIVITGEEDFFCSGLDLSQSQEDLSRDDIQDIFEWHVEEFASIIRALIENPKLVLGRINGPAAGFGAEMIYWFDYKIAVKSAYFSELFTKRGLVPDGGGIIYLSQRLGISKTLEKIAFAEKITAEEALQYGIINEIVEDQKQLDERVSKIIEKIKNSPPGSLSKIKMMTYSQYIPVIENHIRWLRVIQAKQVLSEEFFEGISAFLSKREPKFKKIKF
ncbi:Carnitinyl-CoA dehydratase [bacterium HR19]|nr:Carnitinyl-CoA dehydratase [bacterium HR19]